MRIIDFFCRLFAGAVAIYVVYNNQQQQMIAIICLAIAVVGIRRINEIMLVLKEKIIRAKRWDIPNTYSTFHIEPKKVIVLADELSALTESFPKGNYYLSDQLNRFRSYSPQLAAETMI